MTNRIKSCTLLSVLLMSALLMSFPSVSRAEGPIFSTGFGFELATGKYGTGSTTDTVFFPITLGYFPTERLAFSLEVPLVYQSNSAMNTSVFGGAMGGSASSGSMSAGAQAQMMLQKRRSMMGSSGSGSMGSGTMGSGAMGSGAMGSGAMPSAGGSMMGLGDLTLKAGYVLVPEGTLMPRVRPYLSVRMPTASSDALGTGAFAEGGNVELLKTFGNWIGVAEGGYTFQQKSDFLQLKDYLSYDAGVGYAIGDKLLPMLMVKGSTAPVEGSSDLLEVRLKLRYQPTVQTGIECYLAKGITTNSPDYGTGFAVYHDF